MSKPSLLLAGIREPPGPNLSHSRTRNIECYDKRSDDTAGPSCREGPLFTPAPSTSPFPHLLSAPQPSLAATIIPAWY